MTWKKGSKSSVPAWFEDAMDEWCESIGYDLGWDLFVNNAKPGHWVVVYDSYDGARFVRYSGFPMGLAWPHGSDLLEVLGVNMLGLDAEDTDDAGMIRPSYLWISRTPDSQHGTELGEGTTHVKACFSLAKFAQKLISDPKSFPWWRKTGQADKEYEKGGA